MSWYRSLYWRIALGFVLFLAAMLVVQAVLFTWAVAQSGRTLPGQSPIRFAETIAFDLATAIERDPSLDVSRYVKDQYTHAIHPFFVVLQSGQVITNGTGPLSDAILRFERARLQRLAERPELGRGGPAGREWVGPVEPFERFGGPDRAGRPDAARQERAIAFRFARPIPILVHGKIAGLVVVPPRAPFGFLLGRFAPTLSLVAAGVLVLGTVLATVMVFGPARRRLRALESAARRLGAGDLSARAPGGGGDEIGAVASAFNQMADDLAARADALAASDRARRQLLADVSHELTTPVTAMRGYLETLTMPELALDEATRGRYLAIIGDETARLERMIGDLLDLARLEGGGGELKHEAVRVADLFARVQARHEGASARAGVAIRSTIEPGADALEGDRSRLEQALQNLAANALRYAPAGSTIELRARRVDGQIALAVEDAGPGITPDHLPRVFDRFYKAEASRTQRAAPGAPAEGQGTAAPGGSGLGLSIVKAIVERHGGRVGVESRPGRTVFEIVLPAAAQAT